MTGTEAFLYAAGAGLVISVLDYASLHSIPKIERPPTFSDLPYLFKFFGHPVIGGFLSYVLNLQLEEFSYVMALITGAAAPSLWHALVRAGPGMLRLLLGELGASEKVGGE